MSITDYSDTPAGNATGLFPEGMARSQVNDGLRIAQSDLRAYANDAFFDVGTGSGPATYAFVSTNSFSVGNTDVTAFYSVNRRVRLQGTTIGTVFATVTSAVFTSPNTVVTVDVDGGVNLVNETLAVALSTIDADSLPPSGTAPSLILTSTDPGGTSGPNIELFRDSATPAVNDLIGQIDFTGNDSSASKATFAQILTRLEDPTDGGEDAALRFLIMRDGGLDEAARLGFGQLVVQRVDGSGTTAGPTLRLVRVSSSPDANDNMGRIEFEGRDSAGNPAVYANVQAEIVSQTSGAETGRLTWELLTNGTSERIALWTINELIFSRKIRVQTDGTCIDAQRTGGDGQVIRIRDGTGTVQGSIALQGTSVFYNTFTGTHWAEFFNQSERDPLPGTLLSTADGWHDYEKGLPLVEVTKKAGCKRIYGVFGGRDPGEDSKGIHVISLGTASKVRCTGPVEAGDLLTSSDVPGVAVRQNDDCLRSSTLGKVVHTDLRNNERLVAADIMAG